MKIGVITKREKAHKAGSVMQEAAELLRSRGVEVEAMRDKIVSTKMLQSADVPLPETWFASKPEQLAGLLKEGPIVVKPFWAASQGRGVQIVKTEDELATVITEDGVIFAQRYYQPDGRDHKLYVIGDRVFGV